MARTCTTLLITATLAACQSWDGYEFERRIAQPELAPARTATSPQEVRPVSAALDPSNEQRAPVARAVDRGTGIFVAAPPERSRAVVTRDATEGVTLNAENADVKEIVRMILDEILHENYIIDPAVQGSITIQTSYPVPVQDLPAILDAVLRMNGAALVESGDVYKVVPIEKALTAGISADVQPVSSAGRPGFGVQIVPLRYVSAGEIARLLQPFTSSGDSIQADTARNLLLLAGGVEQLATFRELAAVFDVDWLEGMSFGLFPLEAARAQQMTEELKQLFDVTEAAPLHGILRLMPIERLNAVLVISSQPSYIDRVAVWIERLDRDGDGDSSRTYVYAVQNGRAADLAEVLSAIFDARKTTVGPANLLRPGVEPVELYSTRLATVEQTGKDQLDEDGRLSENSVRIIADETTNSLIIHGTYHEYRDIRSALERLDVRPLQVLIEATIAEVTLRNELRFGIDWFLRSGDTAISLSSVVSGAVRSQFPGFSAIMRNNDVVAVLNALEQITDVNVISSPQLVVLDNESAELQVGDQVPIITQQAQSIQGSDAPILQTIEQVPTGVLLTVLPRVNASGLVTLEIRQEVSDAVETRTSGIDSPTISQRRITSTVAVQSGETVALGGLIRDNGSRRIMGVPLLSRLPLIGPLFGVTDRGAERTELLILITPRVIASLEEARLVTEELRRRIRAVAPLSEKL